MTRTDAENKLFRTDHLTTGLRRSAVRGGVLTLTSQTVNQVFALAGMAVLARLLTPADFGLVAMVTAVTGFVSIFRDLGLSMATVQQKEINRGQVSNLFWANVAAGLICCLLVVCLSPLVAHVYKQPALTRITIALSLGFIFSSLSSQHQALMQRHMQFGRIMAVNLSAQFLALVVTVIYAFVYRDYWAMVILPLATALFSTAGNWIACPFLPGRPVRGSGVRPMLNFGGYLTLSTAVNYFARNLDDVLVGRKWGENALGLYNRAYAILLMPIRQINGPLASVAVPALSRLVDQPDRFARFYLNALTLGNLVTFPLSAGLILFGDVAIRLLLGDKWVGAIDIFRLLAISAFVQPVLNSMGWLYIALGRTKAMAYWTVASSLFTCASFLVGLPWGAKGVALAYSVGVCIQTLPCIYYGTRGSTLNLRSTLTTMARPAVATLVAAAMALSVRMFARPAVPEAVGIVLAALVMVTVFAFMIFVVFGMAGFVKSVVGEMFRPAQTAVVPVVTPTSV